MPVDVMVVVLAVTVGAFTALGAYVAGEKGRSETEGALLGFCFSAVGVIVEALLPTKPRA